MLASGLPGEKEGKGGEREAKGAPRAPAKGTSHPRRSKLAPPPRPSLDWDKPSARGPNLCAILRAPPDGLRHKGKAAGGYLVHPQTFRVDQCRPLQVKCEPPMAFLLFIF